MKQDLIIHASEEELDLILCGVNSIEVLRKPKCELGCKVYIYHKPSLFSKGKIFAEATLKDLQFIKYEGILKPIANGVWFTTPEDDVEVNKQYINIKDLIIYDEPKTLKQLFKKYSVRSHSSLMGSIFSIFTMPEPIDFRTKWYYFNHN